MSKMNSEDKLLVGFIIFAAIVLSGLCMFLALVETEEWLPTEDPDCVMHHVSDENLFSPDVEGTTRYCVDSR